MRQRRPTTSQLSNGIILYPGDRVGDPVHPIITKKSSKAPVQFWAITWIRPVTILMWLLGIRSTPFTPTPLPRPLSMMASISSISRAPGMRMGYSGCLPKGLRVRRSSSTSKVTASKIRWYHKKLRKTYTLSHLWVRPFLVDLVDRLLIRSSGLSHPRGIWDLASYYSITLGSTALSTLFRPQIERYRNIRRVKTHLLPWNPQSRIPS